MYTFVTANCVSYVEPSVTEKAEDSDTDVDESMAQTKPQDEPQPAAAAVTDHKQNDSEADGDKAETMENKVEKTADNDKPEDSVDAENAEEKKDVVVIEDEEEEPEPEDEVVEDRNDGGEDPSEVEVEKFSMPSEHAILNGKWLCMHCSVLSCYRVHTDSGMSWN